MMSALIQGFALVWVSTARLELSYEMKRLSESLKQAEELRSKLEVERNNLTSTYNLQKLAEQLTLEPANPGQIRTMDTPKDVP